MQLSARIRPRDLEEFFSSVGKVRDVRLITDPRTKRSKGIAYIEFRDISSVPLAIGLTNQRLLGVPMIVQASQGERNRIPGPVTAQAHRNFVQNMMKQTTNGPMRLYVGSLHVNITEDMLKEIFEPFGKVILILFFCF
jgi:RNA-binding protein 23/39